MDELIAFYAARLEEKKPARVCGCLDANHWPPCTKSVADYHDRLWREIAAGRQLLTWYADAVYAIAAESYLNAIRALAAVDSDHPDYKESWRP